MNTTTETTVETPETSPQMPATPRSTPEPLPTQPETQPEPEQPSPAPTPETTKTKGKGKGKVRKSLTKVRRSRVPPSINNFPELSAKEQQLMQAYIITPIPFKDKAGNMRFVSVRRKIYFYMRLKGYEHAVALRKAGLCRFTGQIYLTLSKSIGALKTFWKIDQINLDYLLDRLVALVQSGTNENARVRAVKLISELKGYYSTRHVIDVNETMQVQFSMSGPAICPHCHHSTIEGPGQPALPAVIQDALSVGSGGE